MLGDLDHTLIKTRGRRSVAAGLTMITVSRHAGHVMCRVKPSCGRYSYCVTHSPAESPGIEITVNDQGRVTIPVQVRRAAGIEAGVPLVVYVEDGRVVIETREQLAGRIRRDVAAAWTGTGSVVDELIADRRAEAAREDHP